jgi:hypothetical protein
MEKDSFELATGPAGETGHCENTTQMATETTSPPRRQLHDGYDASRFNALRHGVLSAHTVLPWEDEAEYGSLLGALVEEYAPCGPTEVHLIEEIAGVIWRKRRLRLAEAAAYRRGLERTTESFSGTVSAALIQTKDAPFAATIVDAVTATPSSTAKDLVELDKRKAATQSALEILRAGEAGAYEAALAELDESTYRSWQEEVAPELDEEEDPDSDVEPFTADATGLADYLEGSVLPCYATERDDIENRPLVRAQALGEALNCDKLERLGRYEVQLDRKLERMLAMLLRLQDFRRSNKIG